MRAAMMDTPLSIGHILDRAARFHPDAAIVSVQPDRSRRRSDYATLARRARALAYGLEQVGLQPGDRVATLMWNHQTHIECYFGIPLAGGVYHTLNLRLAPQEIAAIVRHAGDRFLVVDEVLLPLYRQFANLVEFERVLVARTSPAPLEAPLQDFEGLLVTPPQGWDPEPPDEHQAAGLCYTSGTTGGPKGVVYSHRAIVLHSLVSAMTSTLGIREDDTVLPVVPMFHANAWGLPFTCTLVGCKQVLPGPHLDAHGLLDLYADEGVTLSAGVPTIWMGIQQALEADPGKWKLAPGLRMVVGGSAAPESMIRTLDGFGLEVIHAWGMTEMTPLGSVARLKGSLHRADPELRYRTRASQGVPAPLVDVRVQGPEGPVPWDGTTHGELQVRGPWVAESYFREPDRSAWTGDGWFRTGDVVTMDPEGYLRIVDRTKDLIKSGGEWISSVALENALMGHPAVREAAVIAIPDPKWGERPLAILVFRPGPRPDDHELRAHLAPGFPKWALPDRFEAIDAIPRTSTGKFLKTRLREMFAGVPSAPAGNPEGP